MPNPFSINVVTPAGASLIASATATNQIVFIGAKTATTAATDAADLASKALSFYDGASGSIDSCSATDSTAKIVVRFENTGGAPQTVKSACIIGKLASQSDADAVIVAAMSDDDSEIILPSSASPGAIIRFPFNININVAGSVSTVYGDGATLADLQRFVSMYKAGDPTSGEDQSILGTKVFRGDVGVGGFLQVADFIRGNNGCGIDHGLTINSGDLDIKDKIVLGDDDTPSNLHGTIAASSVFTGDNVTGTKVAFSIEKFVNPAIKIQCYQNDSYDDVSVNIPLFNVNASGQATISSPTIVMGAAYNNPTNLSVDGVITLGKSGQAGTTLTVNGDAGITGGLSVSSISATSGTKSVSIDADGFSVTDGTNSVGFGSNGNGSVSGTMYVGALNSSGAISALSGSVSGALSVGSLTGLAPALDTSVSPQVVRVPIGGIIFVWSGDLPGPMTAGQANSFAAGSLRVCVWDEASGAWAADTRYAQPGIYAALASYSYSASALGDTAFPLVRISDISS